MPHLKASTTKEYNFGVNAIVERGLLLQTREKLLFSEFTHARSIMMSALIAKHVGQIGSGCRLDRRS